MARKGLWIVIEGIDGAGKSTLADALCETLARVTARPHHKTCEPTDGAYGQMFRSRMSEHLAGRQDFTQIEQLQLLTRDRITHTAKINQLLKEGVIIIQDRFWPSTVAYQGSGLDPVSLLNMHQWLFAPGPDLIIWLDVSLSVAHERLDGRGDQDQFRTMIKDARKFYAWMADTGVLWRLDGEIPTKGQVELIFKKLYDDGLVDRVKA